jgi:hypothetical protein
MGDLFYRLVILEATTPFEIGGNFKPDEILTQKLA